MHLNEVHQRVLELVWGYRVIQRRHALADYVYYPAGHVQVAVLELAVAQPAPERAALAEQPLHHLGQLPGGLAYHAQVMPGHQLRVVLLLPRQRAHADYRYIAHDGLHERIGRAAGDYHVALLHVALHILYEAQHLHARAVARFQRLREHGVELFVAPAYHAHLAVEAVQQRLRVLLQAPRALAAAHYKEAERPVRGQIAALEPARRVAELPAGREAAYHHALRVAALYAAYARRLLRGAQQQVGAGLAPGGVQIDHVGYHRDVRYLEAVVLQYVYHAAGKQRMHRKYHIGMHALEHLHEVVVYRDGHQLVCEAGALLAQLKRQLPQVARIARHGPVQAGGLLRRFAYEPEALHHLQLHVGIALQLLLERGGYGRVAVTGVVGGDYHQFSQFISPFS